MVYVLADNIISPLGDTSEDNYRAIKAGRSGLRAYAPMTDGIPDGFTASLLPDDFEELVCRSAGKAIDAAGIDVSDQRSVFILSSTKGAIEQLGKTADEDLYLGRTAQRISVRLGFRTRPVAVCNACISGSAAVILACRLLQSGGYDHAVVCGADCPGRFIISGFQSLNAMSAEACRPFDIERQGMNLGAAAATVVLGSRLSPGRRSSGRADERIWQIGHGYIRNDAFHISTPSKTADGLTAALQQTLEEVGKEDIAFVNAHGTATLFNDQMEAVALRRAGLSDLPVNALKGYIGHTLGAAGIFETILGMKSVDDHTVLGTRGYREAGVSGKVLMAQEHRPTDRHSFLKMLSGFGGCNATLYARSAAVRGNSPDEEERRPPIRFRNSGSRILYTSLLTAHGLTAKPFLSMPDRRGTVCLQLSINRWEVIIRSITRWMACAGWDSSHQSCCCGRSRQEEHFPADSTGAGRSCFSTAPPLSLLISVTCRR